MQFIGAVRWYRIIAGISIVSALSFLCAPPAYSTSNQADIFQSIRISVRITPDADRKFSRPDAQIIASWKTAVPTRSFLEYGDSLSQKKLYGSPDFRTEHTMVLSGLKPSTIYYVSLHGIDETGREAQTTPVQVVAPKVHSSAWETAAKSLWGIFPFANSLFNF